MVCTSGGDPDSPVGKGCQVKDTLHSVCLNPRVHVCLEGVMWSGHQILLITNSWRDPASANQISCWPWHQEEGGASKLGIFMMIYSFSGQMWSSKRFWQNLKYASRPVYVWAPVQRRAVQLSQMSLLSSAFKESLCAHVNVLWFCEGKVEDATGAGMQAGMPVPPFTGPSPMLKMISSN